jgi:hypothetical protein
VFLPKLETFRPCHPATLVSGPFGRHGISEIRRPHVLSFARQCRLLLFSLVVTVAGNHWMGNTI